MIKELFWDSDFFNLKIGELETDSETITENNSFELLYIKNKSGFKPEIQGFENNFSEVKVVFGKHLNNVTNEEGSIKSFNETDFSIDDLYELAYESGKYSRFLLDTNFGTDNFKKLYKIWVDNSLNKKFADAVLVFLKDTEIAGFVTYKSQVDFAQIGLIAVSPKFQGQGIGKKLLQFVENLLIERNIFELKIPTQLENEAACNFYKKLGYQIIETTHIMHYWKK